MRVLAAATEDDMVATFLRAELGSSRHAGQVVAALAAEGLDRSLVERPDTADPAANAARRTVLAAYRDYPDGGVFTDLPADTEWLWAALGPEELLQVRYINWDYWIEVSGGTRRPLDAIPRIGDSPIYREIAAAVAGGRLPPALILIGRPPGIDLVVLEGHVRLTALTMAIEHLPPELTVLVGLAPTMDK
jgi:hypothetical protein